jgi:hypothetical protein
LVDAMQLDLICANLIALRVERNGIVKKRADQKRWKKRGQKKIETLWQLLQAKLKLPAESECKGEQRSFDRVRSSKNVDDQVGSLERLKKDRIAASRVGELKSLSEQAAGKTTIPERESVGYHAVIKHVKKQISQYEAEPPKPYARCQAVPCWIKERAKTTANDPATNSHLGGVREKHSDAEQKLQDAQNRKKELLKAAENAQMQLATKEQRLAEELSGIGKSIGKWQAFATDAATLQVLITAATRTTKSAKQADDEIDASRQTMDEARKPARRRLNRISEAYGHLQKNFGSAASGTIHFDGNGLQPMPDRKLAPAGAALSAMTSVLAFDVSCLAESVYGVGQHPRLLLADRAREGEMEGPLFRRLFGIVHELETQFSDPNHVSFQYIVPTTSEPLAHLANPDGPYVVETLHATSENKRLLRRRFE